MKKLIFLLFILAFSSNSFAQSFFQEVLEESTIKKTILDAREREKTKEERLKMARQQGLNYSGSETYPPAIISWGKGFYNGLAKITVNGKTGFINTQGKIIVKPNLKDAGYFSENLAPFESENGKWGFINSKGEIAIKPQFDWALSFKEGYALVQVGDLWGFIDQSGKIVIEPKFKEAASFSESLARVAIFDKDYVWQNTNIPNGKNYWGVIDKQGNWAIKPTLDYIYKDFNGGMSLISVRKTVEDDVISENFFIDNQGNKLWKLNSDIIYQFSDDVLVVKVGEDEEEHDTYSFVDRNGQRVTDKSFSYLSRFSEGLSAARITWEGKFGFINKKGEFVIEPKFESAYSFSEGLAIATNEDDKFGFIDKSGNWIIKPQFYWVENFREGFALVYSDGRKVSPEKSGYINRKGNYIWKPTK